MGWFVVCRECGAEALRCADEDEAIACADGGCEECSAEDALDAVFDDGMVDSD